MRCNEQQDSSCWSPVKQNKLQAQAEYPACAPHQPFCSLDATYHLADQVHFVQHRGTAVTLQQVLRNQPEMARPTQQWRHLLQPRVARQVHVDPNHLNHTRTGTPSRRRHRCGWTSKMSMCMWRHHCTSWTRCLSNWKGKNYCPHSIHSRVDWPRYCRNKKIYLIRDRAMVMAMMMAMVRTKKPVLKAYHTR